MSTTVIVKPPPPSTSKTHVFSGSHHRHSPYVRHTHTLSRSPHADGNEVNPITLTRFIAAENALYQDSTGNFPMLLQSVQLACKVIASATRKAGIINMYGLSGSDVNTSGDQQKKLDVYANEVMVNCLTFSEQVYVMVSEEADEPIIINRESHEGIRQIDNTEGYAIVFDPLDGSSNIDCNLSVGTIFGIYRKDQLRMRGPITAADVLRCGHELIAAGYASYDAATMLVLTTGHGVNMFTLDPSIGEFVLTHRDVQLPSRGKIYSINEGNSSTWDTPTRQYIQSLQKTGKYSGRYVGSMVGDIHRTLLYGGIFCYPADAKSPNGKLRLLYECNPIAMLIEQAGGLATTGRKRILDVQPTEIHGRSPIFCGSKEDVQELIAFYAKYDKQQEHPGSKEKEKEKEKEKQKAAGQQQKLPASKL